MADEFDDLLERGSEAIALASTAAIHITEASNRLCLGLSNRRDQLRYVEMLPSEARQLAMETIAEGIARDFDLLRVSLQDETERFTSNFVVSIDAFLRARAIRSNDQEETIIRQGMQDLLELASALKVLEENLTVVQNMTVGLTSIDQRQADSQVRAAAEIERFKTEIRSAATMVEAVCE